MVSLTAMRRLLPGLALALAAALAATLATVTQTPAQESAEGDPLVAEIQRGLKELGYAVRKVDGLYGPNTRSAIEAFQGDRDIAVTGEPSRDVLDRIEEILFQRSETAKKLWREARLYLRALGHPPGADGFDSPAAQQALQDFRAAHPRAAPTPAQEGADAPDSPAAAEVPAPTAGFDRALAERIARAAESDPRAQGFLCRHHMDAKAYSLALPWCRRAAAQPNVTAQYYVGWMYFYGRGTERAYDKAYRWYRRAAEAGDSRAQAYLGLMYRHGWGVAQDPDAALHWYRRAADQEG